MSGDIGKEYGTGSVTPKTTQTTGEVGETSSPRTLNTSDSTGGVRKQINERNKTQRLTTGHLMKEMY